MVALSEVSLIFSVDILSTVSFSSDSELSFEVTCEVAVVWRVLP